MNVLSLFDGISCGRVALERAGIEVSNYVAYEIDGYAKAISRKNHPGIIHRNNVLHPSVNFKDYKNFDMVMGGSPCVFWSISKTKKRELDKNGMGWKLFLAFLNAVKAINPIYYFYENVWSMPKNIKKHISEELGVEPVMIDSSLVSAQSRKRLYWTNIGMVNGIQTLRQPEDKGILLKDILNGGSSFTDKCHCITSSHAGATFEQTIKYRKRTIFAEPIRTPILIGIVGKGGRGERIHSALGKSVSLCASNGGGAAKTGLYKIDLPDGDYAIRKLTPLEAELCQTLPPHYTAWGIAPDGAYARISDQQRYKCIGNGWTVDVIAHFFRGMGQS